MIEALLVPGVLELVVRRPAVVDHEAVVVRPQDALGHGAAAGRVDDVGGGLRPGQRVQPGRASAYPPARLIRCDPFGIPERMTNAFVDRLAAGGGPQNGVDAATPTELDTEQALQAAHDLAVRQATLLIEFDDGGLGIGSQLGRGGAKGVGRLQGMAPLNPAAALTAPPDVDVELPVDGLARDVDLELLGDVGLVERTAAIGAAVRQGRLMNLVDLVRGWRLPMGLRAVVLAGLASRLLGLVVGLALGEGGGLALAGAGRLVELAAEALVLGLQVAEASL